MAKTPQPAGLEDFKQHLIAAGKGKSTVDNSMATVRRFLKHVGDGRLDRISEEVSRSFFAGIKATKTRRMYAMAVSQFLNFSMSRLPVPVNARGGLISPPAVKSKKEIALRQKWTVEKLLDQKETADDLIAKLARKLSDHYLYFQTRLKGGDENLDEVGRLGDECRELIESNLPLFMALSAGGRNVHPKIDERMRR